MNEYQFIIVGGLGDEVVKFAAVSVYVTAAVVTL
jgi:hypothetical protein